MDAEPTKGKVLDPIEDKLARDWVGPMFRLVNLNEGPNPSGIAGGDVLVNKAKALCEKLGTTRAYFTHRSKVHGNLLVAYDSSKPLRKWRGEPIEGLGYTEEMLVYSISVEPGRCLKCGGKIEPWSTSPSPGRTQVGAKCGDCGYEALKATDISPKEKEGLP